MEGKGMGTQHRMESLQCLRGVAALAVVLFHLRGVEIKYLQGPAILDAVARYADAGVDLFFVLSGFVMTTVSVGRYGKDGASSQFLAKRAWRVLPMYWIFTTLVVVLMALAPGMVNTSYENQSVLASYLLIPHAQLPVLTVGWTLVHEAYFYLVFASAIALVPERFVPAFLLAWAAAVGAAHWSPDGPAMPAHHLVTNPLTYEFIAGALLGLYWRRIPSWFALPLFSTGIAGAMTAAALLPEEGPASMNVHTRVALFGSASVLLLAGSVRMEALNRLRAPLWLMRLGDSSYSLYLTHIFVISAAGRLWAMLVPSTGWPAHLAFVMGTTLACCLVGYIVHVRLERPLLALPRRWRASRQPISD
ncbi:acyltransferase family protein [Stenotrophomonas tuberculopleuritidis]|uniref:acyltransferase family protein n=1 Tax=Stenotrophomonas tuberculopleuritidis TaxID=3055079 RepID=UPI0026E572E7|nr:acyltransferase [Stenotrophomonas sp. 704A1]